jgi:hypothetical protein
LVQVQSSRIPRSAKAKAANDFLRVQVRRPCLGIQLETVRSWDRRKSKIVQISEQALLKGHFAPFNSIWSAHHRTVYGGFAEASKEVGPQKIAEGILALPSAQAGSSVCTFKCAQGNFN